MSYSGERLHDCRQKLAERDALLQELANAVEYHDNARQRYICGACQRSARQSAEAIEHKPDCPVAKARQLIEGA